jgi:LysR family transcriptional regulator (chromosome initiation inhibitor)
VRIPAVGAATLAAVLDAGSMEAAAERLRITPSAVSQRIRALEADVGRVLLVRSKPLRATPAAHPIVRFARQLDLLAQDAAIELGAVAARTSMPSR